MNFPNIVILIDARLELLQEVRALLSQSNLGLATAPRKKRHRRVATPSLATAKAVKVTADSSQKSAPPASPIPLKLPPVGRRERVSRSKRTTLPELNSTLGGIVPAAPVAVPAEKVRAEAARRLNLHTELSSVSQMALPDADQMARKWLQDQRTLQ